MSHYKLWRIEYAFFSEEPYKFEYIWDTQRLMKNSPIISWDMYIDYLRIEQKRHPEEQPEIYIDEVMAIQTDSGIGKALMKYVLGLDMTHMIWVISYESYALEYFRTRTKIVRFSSSQGVLDGPFEFSWFRSLLSFIFISVKPSPTKRCATNSVKMFIASQLLHMFPSKFITPWISFYEMAEINLS